MHFSIVHSGPSQLFEHAESPVGQFPCPCWRLHF